MPAAFDRCVKAGGRVRTISGPNKQMGLGDHEYRHVCFGPNGKSHLGHVKKNALSERMAAGPGGDAPRTK